MRRCLNVFRQSISASERAIDIHPLYMIAISDLAACWCPSEANFGYWR